MPKKITNKLFNLGILDWVAEAIENGLSPLNTFATNALQCLDQGPRIIYTPLDFERTITKAVERTTTQAPAMIERTAGKQYKHALALLVACTLYSRQVNWIQT